MTSLEPRTPHQPGKLQNVSKNECVFTPLISIVNEKRHALSLLAAMRCSLSTSLRPELVQSLRGNCTGIDSSRDFPQDSIHEECRGCDCPESCCCENLRRNQLRCGEIGWSKSACLALACSRALLGLGGSETRPTQFLPGLGVGITIAAGRKSYDDFQ